MSSIRIRKIVFAGVIGALYAALTFAVAPIAYGPVQFRIAEALCIFPFFLPASAPGLFVGCLIANLLSPYGILAIAAGSTATLIAALITMRLGQINREGITIKILACFPPVVINAIIVGAVIAWAASNGGESFWIEYAFTGFQVGLGQLVVMYAIGLPLTIYLPKTKLLNLINLSEVRQ
jgi:uncharacterized membrane protein